MKEHQIARLIRKGKSLGLNGETDQFLKNELNEQIGASVAFAKGQSLGVDEPKAPTLQPGQTSAKDVKGASAKNKSLHPEPSSEVAQRALEAVELEVRTKVHEDAPWHEIKPLAFELLKISRSPESGARILELAFLKGNSEDVLLTMEAARYYADGFYAHIHDAVRAHLVARLWRDGTAEFLANILYQQRNEDYLQPIERLFIFFSMNQTEDLTTPFLYFRKYKEGLVSAVDSVGQLLGILPGRFFMTVAKLAGSLGYDEEARRALEEIKPGDDEFEEALRLSLEVRAENQRMGNSEYRSTLLGQHDPMKRLGILKGYFAATRSLGGFRDRNRPALNELIANPFEYFGPSCEQVEDVSRLLVENRDLEPLLPNILEIYHSSALRFSKPEDDRALWSPFLKIHSSKPRDLYWQGVALLHHYAQGGSKHEQYLWEAKEKIELAKESWRHPLPFSWNELHKSVTAYVAKSIYITESDRKSLRTQLRVSGEIDMVTVKDIEKYIEENQSRPLFVVEKMQTLAAEKNAHKLEVDLILAKSKETHLVNEDLNRIWQLGCSSSNNDLSWRAATVLQSRGSLKPSVKHAWDISGEKRQSYPLQSVPRQIADLCFKGFSRVEMRLCYAVLEVGPLLPDLLALLDPNVRISKPLSPVAGSSEASIEKLLNATDWAPSNKRLYHFGFHGRKTGIPGFIQILPANPWSCLVGRLSERLGINSWGWSLSHLSTQISDLIPRLASRQDLKRQSSKVAKWLRALTPEQRAAWQDFAQLARVLEDEEAKNVLGVFVCQLATAILQNNALALSSLQAMRAPVNVIWRFESWLLSDTYSKLRQRMGTQARVLVPNSLRRIPSIIEKESWNNQSAD